MRALFNVVALGEIVASTQYLDVRWVFRRTALRVRNYVVEMEAGRRPAFLALPLIALPYFQLDRARYKTIVFNVGGAMVGRSRSAVIENLELEDLAPARLLCPAIDQLEQPVVYGRRKK